MNTTTAYPSSSGTWFRRAEAWLDRRGKAAWIAAMVLGFIFFWPVGLGLLAYMIWGKRMFGKSCRNGRNSHDRKAWADNWDRMSRAARPSGNAAFDSYKADMLRRLEDEQEAFEAFLQRLREAKDKTEFDSFMEDRAAKAKASPAVELPTETDARRGEY